MPKSVLRILFWILSSVTIFAQVASGAKSGSVLMEYQKIVKETQKHRVISIAETGGEDESTAIDQYGFMWMISAGKVYRFNGIRFTEEMKQYPLEERDAVQEIVSLEDEHLYVIGKHYVYQWLGHAFAKHAFDENDRIVRTEKHGGRILCLGDKGYAVYGNNPLPYTNSTTGVRETRWRPFERDDRIRTNQIIRYALDSENKLLSLEWVGTIRNNESGIVRIPTNWTNDLYLKISHQSRLDSILVLSKDTLNRLEYSRTMISPQLETSLDGSVYLYLKSTPYFFKIDSQNMQILQYDVPDGNNIETFFSGLGANWVLTSDSRKCYVHQLNSFLEGSTPAYTMDLRIRDLDGSRLTLYLDGKTHTYIYDYASFMSKPQLVYAYDENNQSLRKLTLPILNSMVELRGYYRYVYARGSDQYLMVVAPNPRIANTHFAYMYDLKSKQLYTANIADEATSLSILNINPEDRSLFLRGATDYYKITFDELSQKIADFPNGMGFDDYACYGTEGGQLISAIDQYYAGRAMSTRNLSLFKYESGELEPLRKFEHANVINHDPENNSLYLWGEVAQDSITLSRGEQHIIKYQYKIDSLQIISKGLGTQSRIFHDTEMLELGARNFLVWEPDKQNRPDTSYVYKAFSQTFSPFFRSHRISPEYIFSKLDYTYLGEGMVFFPSTKLQIEAGYHQTSLSKLDPEESARMGINHKLEISAGQRRVLRIPSFLLVLNQDTIIFKPMWHSVFELGGKTMVIHFEEQRRRFKLRVSELISSELDPQPNDFSTPVDPSSLHLLSHFVQGEKYGIKLSSRMFYNMEDQWEELDLNQFEMYGTHLITLAVEKVFWLVFQRAVIRYDDENQMAFAYDQKEGLPQIIQSAYLNPKGELMVIGDDSIFQIKPKESPPKLIIPWFEVNGKRLEISKLSSLNFWENSISIPIEILNILYPESCLMEYRLKGFDNEWRKRPYADYLNYDKLSPGKYLFEIKIYAPDGGSSEMLGIEFRIKPPLYLAWWAYLIYIALGLLILWVLYRWRVKKYKQQQQYLENEVHIRTEEIRERTERLNESITYAYAIQEAMLPPTKEFSAGFKEHFVLWQPRDNVGGDFYWYFRNPDTNEKTIAVIDCTGHGVPGSMLSMMANTLLNNIVKDNKEIDLGTILNLIHKEVCKALHQHIDQKLHDGMDISILRIDESRKTFSFVGAGQNLIYYVDDEQDLNFVRGSRQGIGGEVKKNIPGFVSSSFSYNTNATLYLYTDGIVDQSRPDSKRGLRYGHQRWLKTINSIHKQSMSSQGKALKQKLKSMIDTTDQRDDITVIGLRI